MMQVLGIFLFFGAATCTTQPTTYDYVIVGGGTTGLVVANRLTEDPTS
jgi:ribulose 1,5-bisphosphate synthetase/thiazole synthase